MSETATTTDFPTPANDAYDAQKQPIQAMLASYGDSRREAYNKFSRSWLLEHNGGRILVKGNARKAEVVECLVRADVLKHPAEQELDRLRLLADVERDILEEITQNTEEELRTQSVAWTRNVAGSALRSPQDLIDVALKIQKRRSVVDAWVNVASAITIGLTPAEALFATRELATRTLVHQARYGSASTAAGFNELRSAEMSGWAEFLDQTTWYASKITSNPEPKGDATAYALGHEQGGDGL